MTREVPDTCLTAEDLATLPEVVRQEIQVAERLAWITRRGIRRRSAAIHPGQPPVPQFEVERAEGGWKLVPKYMRDPIQAVQLMTFLVDRGADMEWTASAQDRYDVYLKPPCGTSWVHGHGESLEEAMVKVFLALAPSQLKDLAA